MGQVGQLWIPVIDREGGDGGKQVEGDLQWLGQWGVQLNKFQVLNVYKIGLKLIFTYFELKCKLAAVASTESREKMSVVAGAAVVPAVNLCISDA